jgi:F-type H+-transporting ATPase subunit b
MDALGINIQSLLIYLALFSIVYWIVAKFLIPALTKSIDERAAFIEKVRKDKEQLGTDAVAATESHKKQEKEVLSKATEKASIVLTDAEKEAEAIIKKANETAKSIVSDAQAAIERKKASLEESFDERVVTLVGSVLTEMPEIAKIYSSKDIAQLISKKKHA